MGSTSQAESLCESIQSQNALAHVLYDDLK